MAKEIQIKNLHYVECVKITFSENVKRMSNYLFRCILWPVWACSESADYPMCEQLSARIPVLKGGAGSKSSSACGCWPGGPIYIPGGFKCTSHFVPQFGDLKSNPAAWSQMHAPALESQGHSFLLALANWCLLPRPELCQTIDRVQAVLWRRNRRLAAASLTNCVVYSGHWVTAT